MSKLAKALTAAAGNAGGGLTHIVPVFTIVNSNVYCALLNPVDQNAYAEVLLGSVSAFSMVANNLTYQFIVHRYNNLLYFFLTGSASYNKYVTVDLDDYTVSSVQTMSGAKYTANSYGGFSRLSDTKIIQVSGATQGYTVFDLSTGSTSVSASISAGTSSSIAGHHGTVALYGRSSAGITEASNVYWSAAKDAGPPYTGEIRRGSWNGSALSGQAILQDGINYSRNTGIPINGNYGSMVRFDTRFSKLYQASSIPTPATLPNQSSTYPSRDVPYNSPVIHYNNMYQYYFGDSGSALGIVAYNYNTLSTVADLVTGISGTLFTYYPPSHSFIPLADDNAVALAYNNIALGNGRKGFSVKIYKGSTLHSQFTYTFAASGTDGTSLVHLHSNSELQYYSATF